MEVLYSIMEKLICFEWIKYDFMKNSLLSIICIVPLFGILGTMIVNKKLAFFSDALGHSAFTGMAIGVILGMTNVDMSMVLFGVLFGRLICGFLCPFGLIQELLYKIKTPKLKKSKVIKLVKDETQKEDEDDNNQED